MIAGKSGCLWMASLTLGVLSAVVSTSAQSQPRPYVSGDLAVNGGMGYRNPIPAAGVGVEYSTRRLLFDASGGYAWSRKLAEVMTDKSKGDFGYSIDAGAAAYLRFKAVFFGGGVKASHTVMSDAVKGGVAPLIGGGYEHPQFRATVNYLLPSEKRNAVQGIQSSILYRVRPHLRVGMTIDVYCFYLTDQPKGPRMWGGGSGFKVQYLF